MTSASQMVDVLRHHHQDADDVRSGLFLTEVTSPDGTRRADALWVPNAVSEHTGIVGYEVKVSRADLVAELRDPSKADAWARYCRRWWLAVPDPALIDGLDIPEWWGVCAPPSGRRTRSLTIVRPATVLTPKEPGPAFHRVLMHSLQKWARDTEALRIEATVNRRELARLRQVNATLQHAAPAPAMAQEVAALLEEVGNERLGWYVSDADRRKALVTAARDVVEATAEADAVHRKLDVMRRRLESVGDQALKLAREVTP